MTDHTVTPARPSDLSYLYHLQDKLNWAVGHIPRGGLADRIDTGRVLVLRTNGSLSGYLTYTCRRDHICHVPQVCVDPAIWRTTAGTLLVSVLKQTAICSLSDSITLRSAEDLDANLFWPQVGFAPLGVVQGRRRSLLAWGLPLRGTPLPRILPVPVSGGIPSKKHRTST